MFFKDLGLKCDIKSPHGFEILSFSLLPFNLPPYLGYNNCVDIEIWPLLIGKHQVWAPLQVSGKLGHVTTHSQFVEYICFVFSCLTKHFKIFMRPVSQYFGNRLENVFLKERRRHHSSNFLAL